jgi:hypothetical protein
MNKLVTNTTNSTTKLKHYLYSHCTPNLMPDSKHIFALTCIGKQGGSSPSLLCPRAPRRPAPAAWIDGGGGSGIGPWRTAARSAPAPASTTPSEGGGGGATSSSATVGGGRSGRGGDGGFSSIVQQNCEGVQPDLHVSSLHYVNSGTDMGIFVTPGHSLGLSAGRWRTSIWAVVIVVRGRSPILRWYFGEAQRSECYNRQ